MLSEICWNISVQFHLFGYLYAVLVAPCDTLDGWYCDGDTSTSTCVHDILRENPEHGTTNIGKSCQVNLKFICEYFPE